ncbi:hypothetical protein P2318_00140 [Myxococcaceae bacterium GXIMD 01537]
MLPPRIALALAAGTLALLAALPARAADDVPRQMVFQGRLVRADGSPEDGAKDLRFAVYTSASGGAPVWEESHPSVPVTQGYYAVVLGAARPLPADVFNGQPLHLGVSLSGQSEFTPRLPIVSVPYALRTGDSAKLEGLGASDFARASHGHASVPHADKASDSDKLEGLGASAFARASHTHASVAYADRAGDSDALGGVAAASYSRTNHTHAAANAATSGFMASADKAKLDALLAITSAGAGLKLVGGVLAVDLTPAGGDNGSATTVARSDHRHAPALSCTHRRASNAGTSPAVAYCAADEALTGGSCAELAAGGNMVLSGGEPTNVSLAASAPQAAGGPGFRCTASDSARDIAATAICCRVTP